MKTVIQFAGLVLVLAGQVSLAAASPTASEFLPCHRLATALPAQCLDATPGSGHEPCWDSARRKHDACYEEVRASHVPDRKRIEAAKKAAEKNRN